MVSARRRLSNPWAPLEIVFFRDCGVSSVLESSCIHIYTAVLRAVLPCTHEKIRISRGTHMQFRSRNGEDDSQVNLTPLIDVVFLLLIFFMVSTTFDTTSELKIQLPEASAQKKPAAPQKVIVSIDPRGNFFVNGKRLKAPTGELLTLELHRLIGSDKDRPVVIQSDAASPVQSLVTAMDVIGQMGLKRLSIATTQPIQ